MPNPSKALYSRAELTRLLNPRSVAIVGISPKPGTFGLRTLNNLKAFEGKVYPVNPKYSEIAGHRCHAGLAALPEAPDCVVVAVNQALVESIVAESVAAEA